MPTALPAETGYSQITLKIDQKGSSDLSNLHQTCFWPKQSRVYPPFRSASTRFWPPLFHFWPGFDHTMFPFARLWSPALVANNTSNGHSRPQHNTYAYMYGYTAVLCREERLRTPRTPHAVFMNGYPFSWVCV